jgi:hypothetical protein
VLHLFWFSASHIIPSCPEMKAIMIGTFFPLASVYQLCPFDFHLTLLFTVHLQGFLICGPLQEVCEACELWSRGSEGPHLPSESIFTQKKDFYEVRVADSSHSVTILSS